MNNTIIYSDTMNNPEDKISELPSIQVGLSACLAGQEVRYNGGHKQSSLCLNTLTPHFNFITFCPEVAAGFDTPRPTMRLIGNPESPTLTFTKDESVDLSTQLINGFKNKISQCADLDGYILMKNSPSCGVKRVKVYQPNGHPHQTPGMGLFARALKDAYPNMPIEEEGRLHDDGLYDNFVARVYAYHHFRKEVLQQPSQHTLTLFHTRYKYVLMSHNQTHARALGRIVADHNNTSLDERIEKYFDFFMQTLSICANKKNHTNTLLHILGYLKNSVPSSARQNIISSIHKYKAGITPLTTPLTLLTHYIEQYGSNYIKSQRYLNPYPENIRPIRKYCQ
jgi:uncharacterized protein YbgA (DUF1722 family)/uncharacterized protein YbbK (DUF523 family)